MIGIYCLLLTCFNIFNTNNDLKIVSRKTSFENYYRQNPRFKKFKIDIGQLEHIRVKSNPKYWSDEDVYKYLTNDLFCKDVGLKLYAGVNNIELYLSTVIIKLYLL